MSEEELLGHIKAGYLKGRADAYNNAAKFLRMAAREAPVADDCRPVLRFFAKHFNRVAKA